MWLSDYYRQISEGGGAGGNNIAVPTEKAKKERDLFT